ncbi:hypothetical protein [Oceanisphaera sp. IT1-181]|uniref:hypothetical protein n=1 Tax=Oceanisphaera sp. IT1-181 TaxID=3081199 RepID=UPI0029C9E505|nr:hypothetical protein [Oceanisphaera sp. IT1-181]
MKFCIALIIGTLTLSGCMNCQVATFYKPSISGDSRLRIDSGVPTYVGITLDDVPMTFEICGDRPLTLPSNTAALCMTLELDDAATFRFIEPRVKFGVGSSLPKTVSMTSVEYEIFCKVENGVRKCTSTEAAPITGDVKRISTMGQLDRYAFDPSLEFRGAKDTLHEGAWFGHRLTGKRLYYIRTVLTPVEQGEELFVQLPEVIINGKVTNLPKLNFRAVTEEVCRMIPLA